MSTCQYCQGVHVESECLLNLKVGGSVTWNVYAIQSTFILEGKFHSSRKNILKKNIIISDPLILKFS